MLAMKILVYGLVALAALSCAAVQPDPATMLEDSAVRLAHGEAVLAPDKVPDTPSPAPPSSP